MQEQMYVLQFSKNFAHKLRSDNHLQRTSTRMGRTSTYEKIYETPVKTLMIPKKTEFIFCLFLLLCFSLFFSCLLKIF